MVIAGRAFFPDSKGMFKNAGWYIENFRITDLEKNSQPSVKTISQKLNEYLTNALIIPEEARIKTHIEAQIKNEGGANLTFQPRQGVIVNYTFTKGGNQESRTWHIETISFIVAGFDADGIGRAYFVNVPDGPSDPSSRNTEHGGDLRIGQIDVVGRIIKGWTPELYNLAFVQDAQKNGVNIQLELDKLEYLISWGIMTLQDSVSAALGSLTRPTTCSPTDKKFIVLEFLLKPLGVTCSPCLNVGINIIRSWKGRAIPGFRCEDFELQVETSGQNVTGCDKFYRHKD